MVYHSYLPTIMHMNLPLHIPFIPTLPTIMHMNLPLHIPLHPCVFVFLIVFSPFKTIKNFLAHGHSHLYNNNNNGVCLSMSFILTSVKPNHLTPFINITFLKNKKCMCYLYFKRSITYHFQTYLLNVFSLQFQGATQIMMKY